MHSLNLLKNLGDYFVQVSSDMLKKLRIDLYSLFKQEKHCCNHNFICFQITLVYYLYTCFLTSISSVVFEIINRTIHINSAFTYKLHIFTINTSKIIINTMLF